MKNELAKLKEELAEARQKIKALQEELAESDKGASAFFLENIAELEKEISERKKAEEKLKAANRQLEAREKKLQESNKELQEFAYVASHDLKEPLRMVSSYTQLLERRYKDKLDDKAKKFIDYAVDGAKRMQTLIDDLLSFSRISTQGDEFVKTDVNRLLHDVKNSMKTLIADRKAVITNDKLPEVVADKAQLERLFANLIGNAIKYCNKKPKIHISAKKTKNEWRFSVQDNGIGIDEEFREKVFIIFQRLHAKDKYSGSGIGLAISRRIINRHGGRIWFESEPGKGTTFYFSLPIKNK